MFTSRAEHRLLLGCDSVYERLSPVAERLGILDDERKRRVDARITRMQRARDTADSVTLTPDRDTLAWLANAGLSLSEKASVAKLMQRVDFDLDRFLAASPRDLATLRNLSEEEAEGLVSQYRYAGYIDRARRDAERSGEDDALGIPAEMSYALPGLSREMVEKLSFVRPVSLGQASRIPGVTPAAVSILRMHLRRAARA